MASSCFSDGVRLHRRQFRLYHPFSLKCAIIAHFSCATMGIAPCYFRTLYTNFLPLKFHVRGIQPCFFRGLIPPTDMAHGIYPCYFRALYTQHRHIQFPKDAGITSHVIDQPTEYSCFHDDHASPQALIPVIPSVLIFYFGGESGIRTHGCFRIAGFQDRCLQPLGHLSVFPAAGSAYGGVIVFTRLRPQ